MSLFDPKHEAMPRDRLEQLQLERLQALLARLRRKVRRHREQISDVHVESLSDLGRLPVTEPEDLLTAFPYGLFALPLREVIRLHSAVGPNGMQLVIGHTRNDLAAWGRLVARQLAAASVSDHDVIQISFEGGDFREAAGYALGAEVIEASVIAEDPRHIEYQLAMLQNYKATVLVTTPTNAFELARLLEARSIDPQSLHLLTVLLSRPVPPEDREALRTGLFAEIRCNFGVKAVLDPGLCVECTEGNLHVNEDRFLVEARDGELLITTLCREAMPLLRYCTRIECEIGREACPCGRTGAILRPGRRLDGQLLVRETPLYASQVQEALARTRAAGHPFRLELSEEHVRVLIPVTSELFSDTMRNLVDLKKEIEAELRSRLGTGAEVQFFSGRE